MLSSSLASHGLEISSYLAHPAALRVAPEQCQPSYTEEELELIERVAAMRRALLPQVVHHYPRDLTG